MTWKYQDINQPASYALLEEHQSIMIIHSKHTPTLTTQIISSILSDMSLSTTATKLVEGSFNNFNSLADFK